jgi:hypothetical protein
MAITIQAQLAKKVPIPGSQFSSQQASITITAEVTDLNQIVVEAQRLYALAEQAVDQQLSQPPAPQAALPQGLTTSAPSASPAQRPAASQPYRNSNTAQRRPAASISPAQARYLSQLGERSPGTLAAILAECRVTTIDALTARDASQAIDRLLQVAA